MDNKMKKDLAKLSKDLYENKSLVYNEKSGQDAMREIMFSALGVEEGVSKREIYDAYQKNKVSLFQIIDVAIDATTPVILRDKFDQLANFHNVAMGDVPRFTHKAKGLFRVSRIAAGTQDLRRQMTLGSSYIVETDWYGASVYTELEQFLVGQIDWQEYINRVAESFAEFIGTKIYEAFAQSYDSLRATRKATGTLDLAQLQELVRRIKAVSGAQQVSVYGTVTALSKISALATPLASSAMLDEYNQIGYLGTVAGINLVALPDAVNPETEEFVLSDDDLFIIPTGEKIVDVVLEGESLTNEIEPLQDNGLQMTFRTMRKLGINVNQASKYGHYKING